MFIVFDPEGTFRLSQSEVIKLGNVFNVKFSFGRRDSWRVEYPDIALSKEDTAIQCGPFVCYYTEAIMRGWPLKEIPDIRTYRNHILATILGNCSLRMKTGKKGGHKCDFCGANSEKECAKVMVRGEIYSIC